MSIDVRQGRSPTHAAVLGTAVILFAVAIGLLARSLRDQPTGEPSIGATGKETAAMEKGTLVLPVRVTNSERDWVEALRDILGGQMEAAVPHGRVDLLTGQYAIEVDRRAKWKEGAGQALYYAEATQRTPCLAVIEPDPHVLPEIRAFCHSQKIALLVLTAAAAP